MAFGLAEILTDGWIELDGYAFGMKETAVTVALAWSKLKNVPTVGVVDTDEDKLVWRSDRGLLSLPRVAPPSRPPP
jgi:hypothetical protein